MEPASKSIDHAADLIAQADAIVVACGAGTGVDSGLPDFRGEEGFWRAYPALGQVGLSFYDIASPRAFRAHPERAWGFYGPSPESLPADGAPPRVRTTQSVE